MRTGIGDTQKLNVFQKEIVVPRSFSVVLNDPLKALLPRAKEVAEQSGVIFNGDTTLGSFQGKGFAGEYRIEGDTLFATISQKPFFIPWSVVESKVREFLLYDTAAMERLFGG